MHLQKSSNLKLLICSLISLNLFANEFTLEKSILSEAREKSFDLTQKKAIEDSSILKERLDKSNYF